MDIFPVTQLWDSGVGVWRVNSEIVRSGNRRSHRHSISSLDQYKIDYFESVKEEKHLKSISGFSACPALGLFATSSYDWSVKIWNCEARLVKEICFAESLRGVCFANARGDLLVGFQCHISIVPVTNYLPLNYLEMLTTMKFEDDILEDNVPFDRVTTFSFDPRSTPSLPLDFQARRKLQGDSEDISRSGKIAKMASVIQAIESQDDYFKGREAIAPRRFSTVQEQHNLDEKLRRYQRSALSHRNSLVQSPLLEAFIARIVQSFSSRSELTKKHSDMASSSLTLEQLRKYLEGEESNKIPDDYWPCAPDGFIPNSVVRLRVPPEELPEYLIPKLIRGNELQEWIKKTERKKYKSRNELRCEVSLGSIVIDFDVGFSSIFDGYSPADMSKEESTEYDSDDYYYDEESEEDEEDDDLTAEKLGLTKKWRTTMKPQPKTTLDKYAMLTVIRARQLVKERRKVSRQPTMPVIDGVGEDEDEGSTEIKEEQSVEDKKSEIKVDVTPKELFEGESKLPRVFRDILHESWFPKMDFTGFDARRIYEELLKILNNCSPLTYQKICAYLVEIQGMLGVPEEMKGKTLDIIINNLVHDSATIRRSSLKVAEGFDYTTQKTVEGILACLNHVSDDLRCEALKALKNMLGINDKEALRELFVTMDILPAPAEISYGVDTSILDEIKIQKTKEDVNVTTAYVNNWIVISNVKKKIRSSVKRRRKMVGAERHRQELEQEPEPEPEQQESCDVVVRTPVTTTTKQAENEVDISRSVLFDEYLVEYTEMSRDETIQELRKSQTGYKLLSRVGYKGPSTRTSSRSAAEKIPEETKQTSFENGVMGEQFCNIGHEIDARHKDVIPDIMVSEASSATTRRFDTREIKSDHLVLPKIYNHVKAFRHIKTKEDTTDGMRSYSRLPRIQGQGAKPQQSDTDSLLHEEVEIKSGRQLIYNASTKPEINSAQRTDNLKQLREQRKAKLERPLSPKSEDQASVEQLSSETTTSALSSKMSPISFSYYADESRLLRQYVPPRKFDPNYAFVSQGISDSSIFKKPVCENKKHIQQYVYTYKQGFGAVGERLSRAVVVNTMENNELKPLLSNQNETLNCSHYGFLNILWSSVKDDPVTKTDDTIEEPAMTQPTQYGVEKPKHKIRHAEKVPLLLNRDKLKVRNRNLITNPYTNVDQQFQDFKKLQKMQKRQFVKSRQCNPRDNSPQSTIENTRTRELWANGELINS